MLTNICKKEVEELYPTPIFQQTSFWSVVKSSLGANTIAINFSLKKSELFTLYEKDSLINSDILVILQQINRDHSIAYIPYGPEIEPDDEFKGQFLEELSE
ncbi:MAG: peptidoglycan bridge formation protein FemAB, partial [Fermentimonas sp.]|nr:peptidoglycan bridge formation protein FemAB [Fermentimonas sp.]